MTDKETVWLTEYLKCWNATEAARRAEYKSPDKQGQEKKAKFAAEIKAHIDELIMSADEAMILLSDQARGSHADFANVNLRDDLKGHPKAHLVKTVVTDVYEDARGKVHHKLRLELYDAQAAIRDILRIHGRFKDTVTNLNYDLSKATDEQLQRIAAGDDPALVLSTKEN